MGPSVSRKSHIDRIIVLVPDFTGMGERQCLREYLEVLRS